MKVLDQLPVQSDPRLLVNTGTFDDAGVIQIDEHTALVQSVDVFPPVVDEPHAYGAIAAANALSDIYAMGARPLSVLNVLLINRDKLGLDVMAQILQGAAEVVRESGALGLGGHTVDDAGVVFGLAVTGVVKPGAQVTNSGGQPGDVVYLSKPIGMGTITTAAKNGKCPDDVLAAAIVSMRTLNKGAAEAMVAAGVHAATDVTGYGLLGHGHELASGSGVDLHLSASALPVANGARELMAKGQASGGAARTRAHLGERLVVDAAVPVDLAQLAADSETSGGLLMAVAPAQAPDLERELAARGVLVAAVGRLEARAGAESRLVLEA